ncbi:hypothetical protein CsSME_00038412 [Camellia sinensis var. sinensis]
MPEMEGPSKPPQISEMFQKFALAFKTKTFEFFAEEDAEEFITDQKVVVIKPDQTHKSSASKPSSPIRTIDTQFAETLISSLFATISSFEAYYLQLQTAHSPFDEDPIKAADKARLSMKTPLKLLIKLWSLIFRDCLISGIGLGIFAKTPIAFLISQLGLARKLRYKRIRASFGLWTPSSIDCSPKSTIKTPKCWL